MSYQELKQLRRVNPDQAGVISEIEKYLSSLQGSQRNHINASAVAQRIGAPRDKVIGLLMAAASLGLLRLKYRVICPNHSGGIRDYETLSEIPPEIACDVCNETLAITPDDIEYFFELTQANAPMQGAVGASR